MPVAGDLTAAVAVFLGLVFFVPLLFVFLPALKGTMFCFSSVLTNWPFPVAAFTVCTDCFFFGLVISPAKNLVAWLSYQKFTWATPLKNQVLLGSKQVAASTIRSGDTWAPVRFKVLP